MRTVAAIMKGLLEGINRKTLSYRQEMAGTI